MAKEETPTVILQGPDDYPKWAQAARARLKANNCEDAIESSKEFTKAIIVKDLLKLDIKASEISNDIIIKSIQDDVRRQEDRRIKAAGLIQGLVGSKNQQFIENKTAEEMWTILKTKFQDTSPMSQMEVLMKASHIKMSDYHDVAGYCNAFEAALDKITGMISTTKEGEITKKTRLITSKTAEAILQAHMLTNIIDSYKPLIAQLRDRWTADNTDLSAVSLSISRYKLSNRVTNAMISLREKAPIRSCTNPQCIKLNKTSHWPDSCWITYPHLRKKYAFNRMKPRGTKKNTEAKTNLPLPISNSTPTKTEPPNITS